jgi:tryptophanyl-tRNA synthetase
VLRRQTLEMAAALIALGLDPKHCTLFVQSDRPEHTELCWLLTTVTPVGWLERTPTYKEKRANQPDDVNHGLLTYPVLQAADIVLYKASLVPVGKDQAAHLELSREIVRAFNARYGETFPEPQAVYTEAPVVLGTDGVRKMSKSIGNTIEVLAEPDAIRKQVMSMVTDTKRILRSDPGRPGSATSASCIATSATTTRRSGRASAPLGPAASIPRSCWPSGSSPTTRRPANLPGAHGRPGSTPPHPRRGRRAHPAYRAGDHDRGSRTHGAAVAAGRNITSTSLR